MTLEGSIVKLMSHLEKHTTEYLQNEVAVKQIKCIAVLKELQSLDLKSLTSIISVAGDINMFLAFSFE